MHDETPPMASAARSLTALQPRANVAVSYVVDDVRWSQRRMSRGRGKDNTQHDFPDELARHRPSLERSAQRLCRNRQDAEDLVQTTMERAWRAREQFVPGGNLGGWLFRILSNRHRDNLRKRTGVQVPLPDDVPDPTPEPDELSSLLGLSPEAAIEALQQLPPDLRAPLELHAVRKKRYREIADELNIPINTVGTRIRRARQQLHSAFAGARTRQRGGGP